MTAVLLPAPPGAATYLAELATNGTVVAQVAATLLSSRPSRAFVVLPEGVEPGPPETFETAFGAAPAPVLQRLTQELVERFGSARLIVTLPLATPSDPFLARSPGAVAVCGEAVSVATELSTGASTVEKTLRLTDPSHGYVAIVVDADTAAPATRCPAEALRDGTYTLRAVVGGAYDGEGFILSEVQ